jgi:UDP-glucose 4-epimerase
MPVFNKTIIVNISLVNRLKNKKILVTGGNGFIGKKLLSCFRSLGVGCSKILRGGADNSEGEHYIGDLTDAKFVSRVVEKCRPDIVYHLAGTRVRSLTAEAFRENINSNLLATIHLVDALNKISKAPRFVLIGTAEEYGQNLPPFTESMRECPVSAYSFSKVCATHFALMMAKAFEINTTVIRPSIAYGPGQKEDMFLPSLIGACLRGEDFAMTSGLQHRDFIYVDDLVEAIILGGLLETPRGEIINVGAGVSYRIFEVVEMVKSLIGIDCLIHKGKIPNRPNDIIDYSIDISKAKELLGWQPKHSLQEGLNQTIKWYKTLYEP